LLYFLVLFIMAVGSSLTIYPALQETLPQRKSAY
jgi:hypothetical protein